MERGLGRHPDFVLGPIALAAAYAEAGRADEAAATTAAKVRRLYPFFEVDAYGDLFRDPADRERIAAGLRKAGLG